MPRLRNVRTGVAVTVRDGHPAITGPGWEAADVASQPNDGYSSMTVDELKDEIRTRNDDGRDEADRLLLSGSKADLVASLDADD